MNFNAIVSLFTGLVFAQTCVAQPELSTHGPLTSGVYFVTQSWSQQSNFRRAYHVRVPSNSRREKFPVCVSLHGNGGTGFGAIQGSARLRPKLAARFIMVCPDGYERSWNIVSERSKADDLAFIEAIVRKVAAHSNVQPNEFTILGNSNGAALVNQLAIESQLPNIRNYISIVSPLNGYQFHNDVFHAKGEDNNYQAVANPRTGIRLMNISGARDPLVPYHGGRSRAIPGKNGKLEFLSAERSTFLWARQLGYRGKQLAKPSSSSGPLEFFRYLDGDVVHIKVNGQGHNAGSRVGEDVLLTFIGSDATRSKRTD